MLIDNSISEVYQQDKKVFIPDFGALIYSEFNDEIDFNPHLDFDDGKIILEIQKQESISEDEAKKSLEEYVEQLKANLESKGTHLIGGIGYINKGEDGELTIATSISEPVFIDEDNEDSTDAEEIQITEETQNIDDSIPEIENKEDEQTDSETEMSIEQETDSKEETIISEEELLAADNQETEEIQESGDVISEESETQEEEVDQEESIEPDYSYRAEEDEPFQFDQEDESQQKKRKPIAVTLVVILILAVIAVPLYLFLIKPAQADNQMTSASSVPIKELQVDDENDQKKDETSIDESEPVLSDKEKSESTDEITNISKSSNNYEGNQKVYSLILGSFKVENNADNFEQHLNGKGIEVNKFRRNGSFYFVGIEQIPGKPNAVQLLAKLRKEEEPTAWIIRKP